MASERQIAANQRNARKSNGPESDSGKKRSSKNSYRHGLSVPMSVRSEVQFKDLSCQFAGDDTDATHLALADRAADAHIELERVKRMQAAMLERAPLPGGNEEEGPRFIDAVGRALSELAKTIPYEKRAAGRRDRAICKIVSIKTAKKK